MKTAYKGGSPSANIDNPAVLCKAVGMSMRKTIEVVSKLAKQGVIKRYAIAGAVAALNYIQPTLTEDLDILISVDDFGKHKSGLLLLNPIEKALADMGYNQRSKVGILIEDWPVQFLPAASDLDNEALEQATELDIGLTGTPPLRARSLRPEHIVAKALEVGRLKDWARIEAFLNQKAVNLTALKGVLERHNLMENWKKFCLKAGIKNPLAVR